MLERCVRRRPRALQGGVVVGPPWPVRSFFCLRALCGRHFWPSRHARFSRTGCWAFVPTRSRNNKKTKGSGVRGAKQWGAFLKSRASPPAHLETMPWRAVLIGEAREYAVEHAERGAFIPKSRIDRTRPTSGPCMFSRASRARWRKIGRRRGRPRMANEIEGSLWNVSRAIRTIPHMSRRSERRKSGLRRVRRKL